MGPCPPEGGRPDSTRSSTTAARWSSLSSKARLICDGLGDHHRRQPRPRTDHEVNPKTPAGIALPSPTLSAGREALSAGREGGRGSQGLLCHEVVEHLAALRLLFGLVVAHKRGRGRTQPSIGIGKHEERDTWRAALP